VVILFVRMIPRKVLRMAAADIPTTPAVAMGEIYSQMHESFRHLTSNGVKKSVLDEFEMFLAAPGTLSRPSLIIRCQVVNRDCDIRVIVDKRISQWRLSTCFLPFLQRVLLKARGRSDFFVLLSDNLYVSEDKRSECIDYFKRIPFLRCDSSEIDQLSMYSILMPDLFIQDKKYADELAAIEKAVRVNPFEQRQEIIKWRGSLSGSEYPNLENYGRFPRYALLMMSVKYPDIVDARLTNYYFGGNEPGAALRKRFEREFGCPAETLPAASFVPYKYLISLDGVAAAWKRVATILASGAVLLLHHRWNQFFYPGLKPWIHYVPIKYDVSNLIEQYEWLIAHPSQAKKIAENGLRFARCILHPKALEAYFAEVVNKCSELYI
jgi:hypothetical protein